MSKLRKLTLQALLDQARNVPLVTIYTPTHSAPTPPNLSEDRRRFKNLKNRVMEIIKASPMINLKESQAVERQLTTFEEDLGFWEARTFGMGIFISPSEATTIDLPIDCDEYVAVDDHYHVTPLIGLLDQMVDFDVLVVSKKQPMLFSGDIYGLSSTEVPLPVVQTIRNRNRVNQPVAVRIPPKGNGRQEYFGNNFPLVSQDDVLHYFRAIDRIVQKEVTEKHPLVLAGPEVDTCEYRSISSHPNILEGHIESANSATTPHCLAPLAWAHVHKATIQKQHQRQLERFDRLSNGSERASGELAAIQDAAGKGRIETLIIKLIRTTTDNVRDNLVATPKIHFPPHEQSGKAI